MADKRIPNALIRRVWLDDSLTSAEAARQVGLSRVHLWVRAKALGLPARKDGRRVVVPDDVLTRLWAAGVTSREIATAWGCAVKSVRQAARRLGLPARTGLVTRKTGLTMAAFDEAALGRAMRSLAEAEQKALALAEMVDGQHGGARRGAGRPRKAA